MLQKAKPAAEREFKHLENYAKKLDGIEQLQKWDGAYYAEKLKKELFDLDQEQLKLLMNQGQTQFCTKWPICGLVI